ncbi:hypothetical protein JCM6882_002163 [Rhodosporidiobolus microsporus]
MPRRRVPAPSPSRSNLSLSRLSLALLVVAGLTVAQEIHQETGAGTGVQLVGDVGDFVSRSDGMEGLPSGEADAPTAANVQQTPLREKRASGQTTIPISSSLPSTSSLSSSFAATFDSTLDALDDLADALLSSSVSSSLSTRMKGVPGTAVASSSEARSLQAYLDCTSSEGEWVYDPEGAHLAKYGSGLTVHKQEGRYAACEKRFYKGREVGEGIEDGDWDVRESLRWRWVPSPSCAERAPSSLSALASKSDLAPLSRARFCRLLAHKSTLLLGDTTQYSLHDLILDWTVTEPQSCYGDLYCKEHALCGEILRRKDGRSVEAWKDDERVYHRLPLPPGVTSAHQRRALNDSAPAEGGATDSSSHDHDHHTHSHSHDTPLSKRQSSSSRSPSYGTLLRYRRTDGLRPATAYTLPTYKHPFTGIREINQQWLADARRSDLVVLTKPPLPLPLKGHNATWDEWVYAALEDDELSVDEKAQRVFEAAADVTANVWLPELLEALKAIRAPPSPADQLVVYRSGWRTHADCAASSLSSYYSDEEDSPLPTSPGDGPPPHPSQPALSSLLFRRSPTTGKRTLAPLHTAFHNLQLLLQNRLARTSVLPAFGVPYLDLETPLSVWRSGMVGSSAAAAFVPSAHAQGGGSQAVLGGPSQGLRSPASGDCSRYCFPSPGMAVEEFFLGALVRVFEAGWAGDEEREREWVGDEGFRNLRERIAEREKAGEL